jgi:arabinose operon protein AraL
VELIIGKPSLLVVDTALKRLGRQTNECLMVGDSLETDILMGRRAGMRTVLVLTGVTHSAPVGHAPVQPDHIVTSIAQVARLIL